MALFFFWVLVYGCCMIFVVLDCWWSTHLKLSFLKMPFFVVFVFGIAAKGYFPRCISKCARISHTLRAKQQHFRLVHHRWASLTIFLAGLCDKNKSFPSCLSFKKQKIKTHTLKRISGTKRRFYYYYFFVENRSFIHHTDHLPLLLGLQIITQQAQENSLLLRTEEI